MARQILELNIEAPDFEARLANIKNSAAAALEEAKYQRLGNPRIEDAQRISAEVRMDQAEKRRQEILPLLAELRGRGIISYPNLAKALNEQGIKPPRAKEWTARNLYALEKPQDR